MSNNNVLGQINVISIDVSTWSGGVTLKREEIGVDLPERAFTLGRKHLIAPERLASFPTIRRRARERCLKVGARFLGELFMIPANQQVMDDLVSDLEEMRKEFDLKKTELMRDFSLAIDEWVSEDAVRPFEAMIRAAIPPLPRVERQIEFGYTIFQVGAPSEAPATASNLLDAQVKSMGGTIFSEVAASAEALYQSFLERSSKLDGGKDAGVFTGASVKSILSLRNKLRGLEFVDDRIPPIVDEIDRAMIGLPIQGRIEGPSMRQIYSLLVILSNEERMLEFGRGLLSVGDIVKNEFFADPEPEEITPESASIEAIESESSVQDEDDLMGFDDFDPVVVPIMPVIDARGIAIGF